jgi:hypothetical protein
MSPSTTGADESFTPYQPFRTFHMDDTRWQPSVSPLSSINGQRSPPRSNRGPSRPRGPSTRWHRARGSRRWIRTTNNVAGSSNGGPSWGNTDIESARDGNAVNDMPEGEIGYGDGYGSVEFRVNRWWNTVGTASSGPHGSDTTHTTNDRESSRLTSGQDHGIDAHLRNGGTMTTPTREPVSAVQETHTVNTPAELNRENGQTQSAEAIREYIMNWSLGARRIRGG